MDKLCAYCREECCPFGSNFTNNDECILNLIIYEDEEKVLFYNVSEKRIFKIEQGNGLREIGFQEVIREIDIIPQKEPSWKRVQILRLAKDLGFFGV